MLAGPPKPRTAHPPAAMDGGIVPDREAASGGVFAAGRRLHRCPVPGAPAPEPEQERGPTLAAASQCAGRPDPDARARSGGDAGPGAPASGR